MQKNSHSMGCDFHVLRLLLGFYLQIMHNIWTAGFAKTVTFLIQNDRQRNGECIIGHHVFTLLVTADPFMMFSFKIDLDLTLIVKN